MTRAEIRRQQREAAKSGKTYNLNVQQIEEIKKKAMNEASAPCYGADVRTSCVGIT